MKVLVVHPGPDYSVSDVHRGWVTGLRQLGVEVSDFNLDDRIALYTNAGAMRAEGFEPFFAQHEAIHLAAKGLEARCFEWWPDVVLIVSCFYIPYEVMDVIRARGIKVAVLHLESPYEDDIQLERAIHADLNLVNDPTNLTQYQAVGPARYAPHAYDPEIHRPGAYPVGYGSDFCFVGTAFPSRIEFFEAVDFAGVDVALAGNWTPLPDGSPLHKHLAHDINACIDNTEAVLAYRGTRVSANLYRRESQRPELSAGVAMGPREIELAACGTFFLREPRAEGDALLPMLPTFTTPVEFEGLLRWYLAHPEECDRLAAAARIAIEERTFKNNASAFLRDVESL